MKPETKKTVIKVGKIILNVLFYSVIILLITFSIANMQLKKKDDIANVFGNGFTTVLTDSMDGEESDSFTVDDIVFVKLLNDESRAKLEVGDIITYFSMDIPGLGVQGLITHRISEIIVIEGETFFITKGDKAGATDDAPIHISEALAQYQSKWVGAGGALKYLQTPSGFALFVILPVIIMLVFEGIMLVRNVIRLNNEKLEKKFAINKDQAVFDVEAEKEKIRQQVLEELKKESQDK
ncbi:MAG: signal peptidase I [Tenericutes bacterium HGW-Tenericutes-2]|jgi:signal peptidase|nr:MAG: signal peptidase I [Tenericutes bacterium HGW-Tenericutes-2]